MGVWALRVGSRIWEREVRKGEMKNEENKSIFEIVNKENKIIIKKGPLRLPNLRVPGGGFC